MEYELTPEYDSRKSFYHKATVSIVDTKSDDGTSYELYSYGTLVARYATGSGVVELLDVWCQSSTTLRHVKEFLAQMNPLYTGWTKSDIQRELVEA